MYNPETLNQDSYGSDCSQRANAEVGSFKVHMQLLFIFGYVFSLGGGGGGGEGLGLRVLGDFREPFETSSSTLCGEPEKSLALTLNQTLNPKLQT